jgi:hypothetical protein
MTRGAKGALFFGALAVAIVLAAGPRIASAQAAGPPQPTDLAAGITDYANSEVDAAMAEADAVVSQVSDVELPAPSPTPTAAFQPASPPASGTTSLSPSMTAATPAADAGPIELLSAPGPIPPAPLSGAAGWPLDAGPVAQHDLERSAQKPKPKPAVRASRSIVRHGTFLRVEVLTGATATGETSSSSAQAVARSTVRSTVKSSASGGSSQRPTDRNGPLPFPPFPPNAPAPPNSGVSSTGGGGGQGALLLFFVPVAALLIFGIHRLLRRVHWSGLRMPRRGAALPWRPG